MGLLKVMYYFPNGGRNVGKHQSSNPIFASQDHGFPDFPVFFREAKQAGASWIILDHLGSPSRVCSLLSMMKWCIDCDPSNMDSTWQLPGCPKITDTLYIYIYL